MKLKKNALKLPVSMTVLLKEEMNKLLKAAVLNLYIMIYSGIIKSFYKGDISEIMHISIYSMIYISSKITVTKEIKIFLGLGSS